MSDGCREKWGDQTKEYEEKEKEKKEQEAVMVAKVVDEGGLSSGEQIWWYRTGQDASCKSAGNGV